MWTGYRYAVHYTDRFVFGTEKFKNTYGGFTSNYNFETKGTWSFIVWWFVWRWL